jgi:hypothetical protein
MHLGRQNASILRATLRKKLIQHGTVHEAASCGSEG